MSNDDRSPDAMRRARAAEPPEQWTRSVDIWSERTVAALDRTESDTAQREVDFAALAIELLVHAAEEHQEAGEHRLAAALRRHARSISEAGSHSAHGVQ